MYKICEGLHIGEVMHLKGIKVRATSHHAGGVARKEDVEAFKGKNVKSLVWQPHGDNWLAARIMRVLMEERDERGSDQARST